MIPISGYPQQYAWGSISAIPEFLQPQDGLKEEQSADSPRIPLTKLDLQGHPLAELWFGNHSSGSAVTIDGDSLRQLISQQPEKHLGPSTQYSFGNELPYLMKLIAPAAPLSLQVHPTKRQAQVGFVEEDEQGVSLSSPNRIYKDSNHKPEMLFALDDFIALVGFAVRRKVRDLLEGFDVPLANRLTRRLRLAAGRGMRPVVTWLLDPEGGPGPSEINEFAAACFHRLQSGVSPCPLLDEIVWNLSQAYPGDPGIVVAFLMNPVHLKPGEAIYVSPGTLHSYQSGLAVEIMANSDNVIRAGLTPKHIDRELLIELADFSAHPATRIAPDHPAPHIRHFSPPVEDFELSIIESQEKSTPLIGSGPRQIMCLDGSVLVASRENAFELRRGQCVFVTDEEGPLAIEGAGTLVQCAIP